MLLKGDRPAPQFDLALEHLAVGVEAVVQVIGHPRHLIGQVGRRARHQALRREPQVRAHRGVGGRRMLGVVRVLLAQQFAQAIGIRLHPGEYR